MSLQQVIQDGWARHEKDAAGVFEAVRAAILSLEDPADLVPLGRLLFHVGAEHLGRYEDTLAALGSLRAQAPCAPDGPEARQLWRFTAAAHLCAGQEKCADEAREKGLTGGEVPPESDRGAIRALAAAALVGQNRCAEAAKLFEEALVCASYGPGRHDPLARALAVTGNNLACTLEDRAKRTPEEDRLLLAAAQTGRRFWEIAGDWSHVQSAEYRLAMTHLALGQPTHAFEHARNALAICERQGAGASAMFFAHEALARAHLARGDTPAARDERALAAREIERVADEGMRTYCAGELAKLDKRLAGARAQG